MDDTFLGTLACPQCKSEVKEQGGRVVCSNADCGLRFPIRDGIPIMLIEKAERPSQG